MTMPITTSILAAAVPARQFPNYPTEALKEATYADFYTVRRAAADLTIIGNLDGNGRVLAMDLWSAGFNSRMVGDVLYVEGHAGKVRNALVAAHYSVRIQIG